MKKIKLVKFVANLKRILIPFMGICKTTRQDYARSAYQVRDVESDKAGENLLRAVKHFNSYNLGSRS